MTNRPLDRAHALLFELNRPELAEQELRRALTQDPDDPQAHAMLAHCLARQGRLPEADSEVREALRCGPDFPYAHRIRGLILELRDHTAQAERAYREVLRLDPTDLYAYQAIAHILLRRNQPRQALEAADQGLAHNPQYVPCLIRRAEALIQLDRIDDAQAALTDALRLDPESAAAHSIQGTIWTRRSRPIKAVRAYRAALEVDPEDEFSRREMRSLLLNAAADFFVPVAVLAGLFVALGFLMLHPIDADWKWRLLFGVGTVFGLPAVLGAVHVPLKFAFLRLTPWGRFAATPDEYAFGSRLALGCLALSGINVLLWAFWPDVPGALCGSVIVAALALPFLLVTHDEDRRERRRGILIRLLILVPAAALSVERILNGGLQGAGAFAAALLVVMLFFGGDREGVRARHVVVARHPCGNEQDRMQAT